jgi:DNA-binding winged helix-turn-helix (wHTH) protein
MSFQKVPNFLGNFFNAEMTVDDHRIFRFNSFLLDTEERQLRQGDAVVSLTPKTFDTLVYLVRNAGHLVTKDELMNAIWPDSFVDEGNIPRTIHTLRKALGQDGNGNQFIQTVPTKGYRFVAPVESGREQFAADDDARSVEFKSVSSSFDAEIGEDLASLEEELLAPVEEGQRTSKGWKLPLLIAVGCCVLALASVFVISRTETPGSLPGANDVSSPLFYWELGEGEKLEFIKSRVEHVQRLIGDDAVELDDESLAAIRTEIDNYVRRRDSLSQEPFEEGLRTIYGRASQYNRLIAGEYEKWNVPPAVGIYMAMIESEYRDCVVNEIGNFGMFQFTRKTGRKYGLTDQDVCRVDRQSEAAAHYMSDLLSDFGSEKASWTLALLSYNNGETESREQLRELRSQGITDRTYWAIFQNRKKLKTPLVDASQIYVPRFFATAVIGETPESFDLATPPLSSLR